MAQWFAGLASFVDRACIVEGRVVLEDDGVVVFVERVDLALAGCGEVLRSECLGAKTFLHFLDRQAGQVDRRRFCRKDGRSL